MVVLEKAREAGSAALGNPVVFAVAALYALVKVPVFLMQIHSLLYALGAVVTFPLTPFLLSGLFGVSVAALSGDGAEFEHFTAGGKGGYTNLLAANLVYGGIKLAINLAAAVVAFLVIALVLGLGLAAAGVDGFEPFGSVGGFGVLTFGLLGVVGFAALAAVLVVDFLLQYYGVSAVVGDNGVTDAFSESYRLATDNKLTTLGFMALRLTVLGLLALPLVVALYALGSVEPGVANELDTPVLLALLGAAYAVGVAAYAFFVPYKTAVYRELAGSSRSTGAAG